MDTLNLLVFYRFYTCPTQVAQVGVVNFHLFSHVPTCRHSVDNNNPYISII